MRPRIPEIPTIFKAAEKDGEADGEQPRLADGKFKARQAVSFSNSKTRLEFGLMGRRLSQCDRAYMVSVSCFHTAAKLNPKII